ncbi:MAG TPA: di-trans,poly-cis-decaprenylcistransferase [Longimicrobiales bacterium]|nr:di-trans,poly-cis-decaprenylcistransferase [Longimicrobiales bacterium]
MHVAIIMDGNGRWAQERGLPRTTGHRAGAKAVRRIVEAAPGLGIRTLTLYAFSADNWKRPRSEVTQLLRLFMRYLHQETERCRSNGVRLSVIGRRDRLPDVLAHAIERAERETAHCDTLLLRIAIDYSARDAIVAAAALLDGTRPDREMFAEALGAATHAEAAVPDVDLLIRTGGEQRLSDFLLWEAAYAELFFTSCRWPDFDAAALEAALEEYCGRERRFGRVEAPRERTAGLASAR